MPRVQKSDDFKLSNLDLDKIHKKYGINDQEDGEDKFVDSNTTKLSELSG